MILIKIYKVHFFANITNYVIFHFTYNIYLNIFFYVFILNKKISNL